LSMAPEKISNLRVRSMKYGEQPIRINGGRPVKLCAVVKNPPPKGF
jgi:hypothetical protein